MIGPLPKEYDQNARCAYHMGSPGHDPNYCWALKHEVQDLTDNGMIVIASHLLVISFLIPYHVTQQGSQVRLLIWFLLMIFLSILQSL